ncbi:sodium:proton antiporter [Pseudonocardia sp. WMMC193]|uniref:cation:proton antiporter n=1 Tax=Pseudonocardia sp. WMMC193 TaxID=2911965 RepID=UPI001F2C65AC|nr:sodium:proton antiporter [Pseudonocardia sp. WMMC193]MCF7552077.1 sodium:proton antiporter [Pseudonocardia sp. WMMC193]
MELLIIGVCGLLAIAACAVLSERVGVAAPLVLVVVGLLVSIVPGVPEFAVDPEWILAGVLPPLLFSSAVSMPAMDFRRELGAISGLSVLLVVLSTAVLGLVVNALVPDLGLAASFALGAILSPTDAVATSIVKKVGVAPRITTLLDGESLLNDATALVVLRAAIAATAASVSVGGVLADFVVAVVVAVVVGLVVGRLGLVVRSRIRQAPVSTVVSYALPFAASIPAEELHGSGLVAAVVAGLVTGQGAIRFLSPQHRLSDRQNWRTVETVLEGGIFLLMGLELTTVLGDLRADAGSVWAGVGLAALALVLTLAVRAVFLAPLIAVQNRFARRGASLRPRLAGVDEKLQVGNTIEFRGRSREIDDPERAERFRTRLRRKIADIDYLLAVPLGPREGAVLVWAGMRGAVTLAAAQTLPEDTPLRSLLVFVAFLVAAASLLVQGGTLAWFVRLVKPAAPDPDEVAAERGELIDRMRAASWTVLEQHAANPQVAEFLERSADEAQRPDPGDLRALRLEMIEAQRAALVAARAEGTFDAGALTTALENLDAEQISIELRGG